MGSRHENLMQRATRCRWALMLLVSSLVFTNLTAGADDSIPSQKKAANHFSESVLPLLRKHCYECHSHDEDAAEGGLVLDSSAGWKVGGDSGTAIVPRDTARSLLVRAIEYTNDELQMPPDGKLAQGDIDTLKKWIADGAFDPRTTGDRPPVKPMQARLSSSDLWSIKPVEQVVVPEVDDVEQVRGNIDRFIAAKLLDHAITQNCSADKYTLLRRATFDLIGLPPSLDEIDEFVNDERPNAYERLINRLLDSPHYGERWGRHWLDLARYSDSNGGDINYAHANAWRYRDYVIRSFNNDKPYDEFIREQLAGDLLAKGVSAERRRELLTATGFLMLGPKMLAEVDTDKLLIDIVDEQLDVTGLTFLGMTLGCARCHNHKFDPITTEDYYALAGIFRSTKVIDVLRPENGVSEWLEVDVTPTETLTAIERLDTQKERLQRQLADLGAATPKQGHTTNVASKSIRVSQLPTLRSTTWAAWVRIHTPQNLGGVISADFTGANQGHSLGFDRGNTPRVVWNHGSTPHTIIASAQPISYGQWHHLALTFDAATAQLQLYVDGRVAAEASNVETSDFKTIGVGRREASQQFQLIGDVDEIRVYDVAINESQVLDLVERRPVEVSPRLCWSFDQRPAELVIDSEPGKFNGRPIGVSVARSSIEDGAIGKAFSFDAAIERAMPDPDRERKVSDLKKQIQQLESATPQATHIMAVAKATPVDLAIHVRGSHLNLSERLIPRGTPSVFSDALAPVSVPSNENGRRQLANWIANPNNPLTARVMVNRIWQHHFGEGLVRTPSNFGVRGEVPSHPKLLDWLADEFVASGWSIKHMHRSIMNSNTYRMSSHLNPRAVKHDADNRLLGRYPVRRLEAEAIRDSLLAVTNELDKTIGGTLFESPNKQRVKMSPVEPVYERARRSVYLPSVRVRSYEMFTIFDVSDSGQHIARRPATMVAQQALFLMNNPTVVERARELAERLEDRRLKSLG